MFFFCFLFFFFNECTSIIINSFHLFLIFFPFIFICFFEFDKWNLFATTTHQTFVGLQDVLKTSSRHALKTSPTHLQRNNFSSSKSSSKLLQGRRLQNVFKTSGEKSSRRLQVVFKTYLLDISRRLQDVFKTSCRTKDCSAEDALNTSWRYLEDVLEINKMFTGIYASKHGLLTNPNQYLTNLYLSNLYFKNLRRIQIKGMY